MFIFVVFTMHREKTLTKEHLGEVYAREEYKSKQIILKVKINTGIIE